MSADVPNPFAYSVPPAEIAAPVELVPESPPGKIAVWPVFAVYVAALVASIAAQIPVVLAWVVVHIARGGKASDASALIASPAGFISLVLPAQFCFLAAWWLATRYADRRLVGLRAIGSTTLPAWSYASLAIGSLGTLQLGDYLAQGMQRLIGDWSQELVPNLFKDLDLATGLLLVAVIGLVPPLAEELFFRGYMQRRLLAHWSPWIALPVVAVLFAASHGAPRLGRGRAAIGVVDRHHGLANRLAIAEHHYPRLRQRRHQRLALGRQARCLARGSQHAHCNRRLGCGGLFAGRVDLAIGPLSAAGYPASSNGLTLASPGYANCSVGFRR